MCITAAAQYNTKCVYVVIRSANFNFATTDGETFSLGIFFCRLFQISSFIFRKQLNPFQRYNQSIETFPQLKIVYGKLANIVYLQYGLEAFTLSANHA